jgi:hypothetical protein
MSNPKRPHTAADKTVGVFAAAAVIALGYGLIAVAIVAGVIAVGAFGYSLAEYRRDERDRTAMRGAADRAANGGPAATSHEDGPR